MAIRDLAGTSALSEALAQTNVLLAAVLAELKETNGQRLEVIAGELRRLHERLDVEALR